MQRMHNPEREAKKADRIHRTKALKQKEPTTDFESFMFKCRLCMMGFRRRGMLVFKLVYFKFVYYLFFLFLKLSKIGLFEIIGHLWPLSYCTVHRWITFLNDILRCAWRRFLSWRCPSLNPTEITSASTVIRSGLSQHMNVLLGLFMIAVSSANSVLPPSTDLHILTTLWTSHWLQLLLTHRKTIAVCPRAKRLEPPLKIVSTWLFLHSAFMSTVSLLKLILKNTF